MNVWNVWKNLMNWQTPIHQIFPTLAAGAPAPRMRMAGLTVSDQPLHFVHKASAFMMCIILCQRQFGGSLEELAGFRSTSWVT
jgi:hypothetical protein